MEDDMTDKPFYTVAEVAERTGVSVQGVYKWIRVGKLPAYRFGGAVRVPVEALQQFMTDSHVQPKVKGNDKQAAAAG
jgi:excisionase family DNA binding protein